MPIAKTYSTGNKSIELASAFDFSAVGDGVADDRSELNNANTNNKGILFASGTYLVNSDLTLSTELVFLSGAKLKPASGVTITISGSISAGVYQNIFDMSAGGSIQFQIGSCDKAYITWFGAIAGSESGTVSVDNVTAIQDTINACDVTTGGDLEGDPATAYRNIPCVIPPGMFSVDHASGNAISVPSYAVILGTWSSILQCKNGSNTYNLFSLTENSANTITMKGFSIYGDQANQTGTINGIYVNPTTNSNIYSKFESLYIKEMSGNAFHVIGQGLENCKISNCILRDCKGHNFYANKLVQVDLEAVVCRSAKTGSHGCLIEGTGTNRVSIDENCRFEENDQHGLMISNTGGRITLGAFYAGNNGQKGFYLDRVDDFTANGILAELNGTAGGTIDSCDDFSMDASKFRSNQTHGLDCYTVTNGNITSNRAEGNSQGTDDTSSGIYIGSNSDTNHITGNMCRHGGGSNQQKHGIEINDAASTNNTISNNDLRDSGRTSPLSDAAAANNVRVDNELGAVDQDETTLSSGTATVTFSETMPTANFVVATEVAVNETIYVTSKTTGGFTLNSSNGSSTAVVKWALVRQ